MDTRKNAVLRAVPNPANRGKDQAIVLTATAEQRRHPRVETFMLAEAYTELGDTAVGLITDLSFAGLRLEGSRQMLDTLMPNISRENQHIPAPIRIHFELPGHQALNAKAQVRGGATYTRRKNRGTYQIGMHFIEIIEGIKALSCYLTEHGAV